METQTFTFASSPFVPVAIGFFGLGTGYFIWGGQALFGFPKTSPEVNRSLGLGVYATLHLSPAGPPEFSVEEDFTVSMAAMRTTAMRLPIQ
jgi:hypothetical protein